MKRTIVQITFGNAAHPLYSDPVLPQLFNLWLPKWFSCHSTGCFEGESNEKEFKKGKRGRIVATNAATLILL
jgi:hypothetical protein